MKTCLRACFVALIVLGLGSQAIRAGRDDGDRDAEAALAGRLARMQVDAGAVPDSALLMARSPLCDQPFAVGLVATSGADDETARRFATPGIVVAYSYLGWVGTQPSRPRLLARWAWATLRFDLGQGRDKPPTRMAMVAFPASCTGLRAMDWSALSPAT